MIVLPLQPIYAFLLVFLRVGMVLTMFPLFGEAFLPVRIRIVLSGAIALALAPAGIVSGAAFPASGGDLAALAAQEALLAFGVAVIGRIMFAVVQFAGQLAGEQMGFGLVNAIDPTGSHQISVVAELQYVLSILLFFIAGLHLVLLKTVAWSFGAMPPGGGAFSAPAAELIVNLGGVMFSLAVGLAMPIIVVIFAINVGLGMVGRAVPQINVFMESFPLRIIAGLTVSSLILGAMAQLWLSMFGDMERAMAEYIKLLGA